MKIKCGMILAAGLGKRLRPLTNKKPKALIKIGRQTLLERTITHHLAGQIKKAVFNKKYKAKITISEEKKKLLNTGGGVLKGTKKFKKKPFFVINPDTLWSKKYLNELKNLEKLYFKNQKSSLLLVNKRLSFDKSFKGDFNLNKKFITKKRNNKYIYTGLQIINRSIFKISNKKIFSMNEIWENLIKKNNLIGLKSNQKFYHLNTFKAYKKLKNY